MPRPEVVTTEQWQAARDELLIAEKEATRARDALAARRRRLPITEFPDTYTFQTPDGPQSLTDLFGGQDQLAVYQFMDNGPDDFCPGCTFLTGNVPAWGQRRLEEEGIRYVTVSNMPLQQIAGYWEQQGWTIPFASSRDTTFAKDCGADYFMLTMFLREDGKIYRTWNTTNRGVDHVNWLSNIADLSVYGRQEDWEDSPPGWPQHPTYG